jgi:hypothetical protein
MPNLLKMIWLQLWNVVDFISFPKSIRSLKSKFGAKSYGQNTTSNRVLRGLSGAHRTVRCAIFGSCVSRCNIVPSGARVLRDRDNRVCVTATTMYRRERGPWRFGRKLDGGDGGKRPRGARSGAPLMRRKGPWLSTELLVRGAWPSRGLPFV